MCQKMKDRKRTNATSFAFLWNFYDLRKFTEHHGEINHDAISDRVKL